MTAIDQSGGFDTEVSYRASAEGRKLRLQYMIPRNEDGNLSHNFCLALSGRGIKGQKREWRFDNGKPAKLTLAQLDRVTRAIS